ncbi:MAG TPA: hypothetical protein PKG95_00105 [Anaerolineaceae bacterium]|jgi:predicted dienelactone hydrolase|nr:hypothetical protein [Anaerolineaceae bacterium]
MQTFEVIILIGNLTLAILMLLKTPSWLPMMVGMVVLAAFGLHVWLEGMRWQMIPLYVLAVILIGLIAYWEHQDSLPRERYGWLWIIIIAGFGMVPALVPVPQLPQPTGPYDVGTTIFYWIDLNSADPYTGEARRLMVQAWYPTDKPSTAAPVPYLSNPEIMAPAIAHNFDLPAFTLSHLMLSQTHSTEEPPFATDLTQTPVLLFSHGWSGMRTQNTYQVEELVSHGYVVVAADHAEGAIMTIFPDGRIIFINPSALPSRKSDAEFNAAARILGQMWVSDLKFLRSQLEKLQNGTIESPLTGHLDLEQVGAFGHSTGGGAVAEFCYDGNGCKAVLTMDAWMVPYDRNIPAKGLLQPSLFLRSEGWSLSGNPSLVAALYENSHPPAYLVEIAHTQHFDFTDFSQLSPLLTLIDLKGWLSSDRVMEIINAYTVTFFDETLRGTGPGVPALQGIYPEAPLQMNEHSP